MAGSCSFQVYADKYVSNADLYASVFYHMERVCVGFMARRFIYLRIAALIPEIRQLAAKPEFGE